MKKLKIFSLLLPFLGGSYFASDTEYSNSEFKKFTDTYQLPENIEESIKNKTNLPNLGCYQEQSPLLYFLGQDPIYCSKNNEIDRISNAERMRNCIRENNLGRSIDIPKKYIYNNNGYWQVVVEGIETTAIKKFTRQEVEDLIKLQEEMCYTDLHPGNIVRNAKTGKVTFIDTEDRSFSGGGLARPRVKTNCVRALYSYMNEYNLIDAETRSMLIDQINQDDNQRKECLQLLICQHYADNHVECNPKNNPDPLTSSSDIQSCESAFKLVNFLQESRRFDKDGIDHEQVKKEFTELKKRRHNINR